MTMKSVAVTYKAPPGDAKVTEAFGHTFYDGKEETIEVDERVLAKLQGNRLFKVGEPQDADAKQADPEAEAAAAKAAKAADDAKAAAQGTSPPLRGAQHNPPVEADEEADEEASEEASEEGAAAEGRTFPKGR